MVQSALVCCFPMEILPLMTANECQVSCLKVLEVQEASVKNLSCACHTKNMGRVNRRPHSWAESSSSTKHNLKRKNVLTVFQTSSSIVYSNTTDLFSKTSERSILGGREQASVIKGMCHRCIGNLHCSKTIYKRFW